MNGELGHDDAGKAVQIAPFDYAEIERKVFEFDPDSDLTDISPEALEAAMQAFRCMLEWVWQSGMKNPDGVKIRSIIVCWIFLKELRSLSLTEMATGYGLEKQSLGRWVDDFKKAFPKIRTTHMR